MSGTKYDHTYEYERDRADPFKEQPRPTVHMGPDVFLKYIFAQKTRPIEIDVIQKMKEWLQWYETKGVMLPVWAVRDYKFIIQACGDMLDGLSVQQLLDKMPLPKTKDTDSMSAAEERRDKIEGMIVDDLDDRYQTHLENTVRRRYYTDVVMKLDADKLKELSNIFLLGDEILDIHIKQYIEDIDSISINNLEYIKLTNPNVVAEMELPSQDMSAVVGQLVEQEDKSNVITSGFTKLDAYISGGFYPSRLYVFVGQPGAGKSTLLLNQCIKATQMRFTDEQGYDIEEEYKRVCLYVTLENQATLTLKRLYQNLFQRTDEESREDFIQYTAGDFELKIQEKMGNDKSTMFIRYFPSHTLTPSRLNAYIRAINSKTCPTSGKPYKVKVVYLDYLQLMKCDGKEEARYQEVEKVTVGLHDISTNHSIPVVTASQTNRPGYNKEEDEVDLSIIAESSGIEKMADFVAFLVDPRKKKKSRNNDDESQNNDENSTFPEKITRVPLRIKKNRSGQNDVRLQLFVNYETYTIYNNLKDAE